MKLHFALIVAVLLVASGCQNAAKPVDARKEANERWNDARSSVLFSLAQDQYKAHDFDRCNESLAKALAMTPNNPHLHTLLAKVELEQGKLELAEKELELAREFGPKDPEPYYLSGVVYQRWQKPQTALQFYRQAGERAPAELSYLLAQSEMLVALDRAPEALTLLQAKVAYFENSGALRDAVGQLLMQAGRYTEAVGMFREASILSEDDDAIRERLASACFQSKQYRECAEVLSRLLQKDSCAKRDDLFAMRGECQLNLNDPHGARRSFETATELNPLSVIYWRSLGRATLEVGDLKRAAFALNRAIGTDPSDSQTQLLMGYVLLKEQKLPEALASFRRASALDASDTVSLCMVGYTCEKMGHHEMALEAYGRALQIKPGDDMARQLMAAIDK